MCVYLGCCGVSLFTIWNFRELINLIEQNGFDFVYIFFLLITLMPSCVQRFFKRLFSLPGLALIIGIYYWHLFLAFIISIYCCWR